MGAEPAAADLPRQCTPYESFCPWASAFSESTRSAPPIGPTISTARCCDHRTRGASTPSDGTYGHLYAAATMGGAVAEGVVRGDIEPTATEPSAFRQRRSRGAGSLS